MDKPPRKKNCPVVTIPRDVDMWNDSPEAAARCVKARNLVKEFRALAQRIDIPKGWTVEIYGGD